ncbi:MAG: YceD family protein, partial [Deltaproteobacteria bacterium]|nr:YceD family protein [Deltaproteobacteria bacterium]
QANYSAAKAGLIGLTKSLARELAPRNILIHGDLEVKISMKCSRCLNQFDRPIQVHLDLVARKSTSQDVQDEQEIKLEYNEILIQNDEIDLAQLIVQEISLDIPMKPLCNDDCPGICPHCGALRGPDGCSCSSSQTVDPRWEKLAKLKSRLNN